MSEQVNMNDFRQEFRLNSGIQNSVSSIISSFATVDLTVDKCSALNLAYSDFAALKRFSPELSFQIVSNTTTQGQLIKSIKCDVATVANHIGSQRILDDNLIMNARFKIDCEFLSGFQNVGRLIAFVTPYPIDNISDDLFRIRPNTSLLELAFLYPHVEINFGKPSSFALTFPLETFYGIVTKSSNYDGSGSAPFNPLYLYRNLVDYFLNFVILAPPRAIATASTRSSVNIYTSLVDACGAIYKYDSKAST